MQPVEEFVREKLIERSEVADPAVQIINAHQLSHEWVVTYHCFSKRPYKPQPYHILGFCGVKRQDDRWHFQGGGERDSSKFSSPHGTLSHLLGTNGNAKSIFTVIVGRLYDQQVTLIEFAVDQGPVIHTAPTNDLFSITIEQYRAEGELRLLTQTGSIVEKLRIYIDI